MKIKLLLIILFISLTAIAYGQDFGTQTTGHTSESDTDGRISLRLAGNGSFLTLLIGFIPEGTVGHDNGFDGNFINDGAPIEFYSFLGTTRLSIQALPELTNTNVQVALGYELTAAASYTLSIDAEFLSTDFDIILEDTSQGTFTDLRQTGYTFSGVIGEVNDRFFLNLNYRSGTLSIEDLEETNTDVHAYFINDILSFQTTHTDLKTVELFNIAGKRIFSADYKNKITAQGLTDGFYIVRCTTASGARIIKKIVK
ncbi:T9SS type A sorting domain-containing protein [Kordia sp. YSTF-M3]|uniref:T9SS type A sorting domain-containing protein n=1 Tax=Kordia aestuariivivens TaxID=2759037 RepID=A0ABR7QAX6_9FLAO|nr:T9SS type A sorting domain-containing protein [Kordia aestuariivivens]MBC8755732.1 T9SS type A sorting domain-containing protein [Kordia aestuariivivens]